MGAAAFLIGGEAIAGLILAIGALVGLIAARQGSNATPMSMPQRALIGVAFAATVAIHVYPIAAVFGPGGIFTRNPAPEHAATLVEQSFAAEPNGDPTPD